MVGIQHAPPAMRHSSCGLRPSACGAGTLEQAMLLTAASACGAPGLRPVMHRTGYLIQTPQGSRVASSPLPRGERWSKPRRGVPHSRRNVQEREAVEECRIAGGACWIPTTTHPITPTHIPHVRSLHDPGGEGRLTPPLTRTRSHGECLHGWSGSSTTQCSSRLGILIQV